MTTSKTQILIEFGCTACQLKPIERLFYMFNTCLEITCSHGLCKQQHNKQNKLRVGRATKTLQHYMAEPSLQLAALHAVVTAAKEDRLDEPLAWHIAATTMLNMARRDQK